MSRDELRRRAAENPCSLGSLSLGRPENGALMNGVRLYDGERWIVAYPDNAWATGETIDYLQRALRKAYAGQPPDARKIYVGDLSAPWGGPLPPHASHQSGRDVDLGYPRIDAEDRWWAPASPRTLDVARTWILVRALLTETDVEVIFIDRSLQPSIKAHAASIGEDAAWLAGLFDLGRSDRATLIRHEPEHLNHMHVRFYNPVAQRIAGVVHDVVARGIPRPVPVRVPNRAVPPVAH
jgi:penicillin-insensitive murein endopeptidase